ncbi:MAG TPA: DNA polymerase/3'-5' exonuclease PolX [Gemmatimonadaceae bacterium]|nr:DNA polymerase/3'-5' exonuclease PolX [Gemmatimonadaceae bacterium]
MEPRSAAHALAEIAVLLELRGENPFRARAFAGAARTIQSLRVRDIAPLVRSRELAAYRGIGPVSMAVLRELIETGDSAYLAHLRETTPDGLTEMLRVPGLGPARIHRLYTGLGVASVAELEAVARDGRLAALPGFGRRTAERVLRGIASLRAAGERLLHTVADGAARHLCSLLERHPGIARVEIAGSLRRGCELVGDVDLVVVCREPPARVAASVAELPGAREVRGGSTTPSVRFAGGLRADLYCVAASRFPVALWRATGSAGHVAALERLANARGLSLAGDRVLGPDGQELLIASELALYEALGIPYVSPELREDRGEVDAARNGRLPALLEAGDIRGVLHCHSTWSDGRASIEEMALAAKARGWEYLGITDHSQAAFYAGGLPREAVRRQHEEIDRLNARLEGIRVLKGTEADILADGRLDYGAELLDRFDYVVGSVHSRFGMPEARMTERILTALEDPHLTILAHPTGRLLLNREPYAVNLDAVLERAAEQRVAVELDCDPHRMDLDWRWIRVARDRGAMVEIGPDAHSVDGLNAMELGVIQGRKAWLEASDVLNARDVNAVLAFARSRRTSRAADES